MRPVAPHLKSLRLSYGNIVSLSKGDIVFVVGPNNGGKSTFLREVGQHFRNRPVSPKWIADADLEVGSLEDFQSFVYEQFVYDQDNQNSPDHKLLKSRKTGEQIYDHQISSMFSSKNFASGWSSVFTELNAQNRVSLADPVASFDVVKGSPTHPYHTFMLDDAATKRFSSVIESTFGAEFRTNKMGAQIHGLVGKAPVQAGASLAEYEAKLLESMTDLQSLGDGIRCFAGILLHLQGRAAPVTILDEPEAFLHPPQARRLGAQIVRNLSANNQAFIATHSSDIIQGALAESPSRVRILYLNHRSKDKPFLEISSALLAGIASDAVLMHSDLLDSMFYDFTILCESESDVRFYSFALNAHLRDLGRDVFWFSCGGKDAMPRVGATLGKLGVQTVYIFDVDVLLTDNVLERACASNGLDIAADIPDLKRAMSSLKVHPASDVITDVAKILEDVSSTGSSEKDIEQIVREIRRSASKMQKSWTLKSAGVQSIEKGKAYSDVKALLQKCRSHGIAVLENGEIESYVKEVESHGSRWVHNVIDNADIYSSQIKTIADEVSGALSA